MILSAEDGKLFYELWMPLLQYANKRTKMFPDIKFKKDTAIDVRFGRDMAEWIWNHTEVIDDYLKEHPGMKEDHIIINNGKLLFQRKRIWINHWWRVMIRNAPRYSVTECCAWPYWQKARFSPSTADRFPFPRFFPCPVPECGRN